MRFGVVKRECEAAYSNVWGGDEAFSGHACPNKLIKVRHVVYSKRWGICGFPNEICIEESTPSWLMHVLPCPCISRVCMLDVCLK